MTSSPPNKKFPGQMGFPTTNAPPDETGCRVFVIPSDEEYFAQFMAAVDTLTDEWRYFRNGDLTPAENVLIWRQVIDTAINTSVEGQCSDVVAAPWWDEESTEDADDTAPIEDQPWYGEIVLIDDRLTFKENLGIWLIAGFMLYSGRVAATLAFLPVARNFVVEARSNPFGGLIRFFFNGIEIATADTYSETEGQMNIPIALPEDMGFRAESDVASGFWATLLPDNPHGLESLTMTIFRSKLTPDDFANPQTRYNEDCDCIQFTPDGGVTWTDAPQFDPRHSTVYLKPPVAGDHKECDAAANMVKWLKDFIDECLFDFGLISAVATIINSLLKYLEFLAEYTTFILLISEVAGDIFGLGAVALDTAFTSDQYDLLRCIFDCNSDVNGRITAEKFPLVQAAITAQLNTTAALITNAILDIQGEIGLSNAGAIGHETGDCTDCECDWEGCVDFTATDGGFAELVSGSTHYGTYVAGVGWRSTYFALPAYNNVMDVIISRSFTEVNLHELTFSVTYLNDSVPQAYLYSDVARADLVGAELSWTGNEGWDAVALDAQESECTSIQYVIVTKLYMRGTGIRPDWLSDC